MFDYVFALRPSTKCNFKCSYCISHDDLHKNYVDSTYDIDSIIWHVSQYPNNIVNICGYGETMLHHQFDELVIELSKVTKVNWITNGTMFNTSKFNNILKYANHKNIHDVIISVHLAQIHNLDTYIPSYYDAEQKLKDVGITVHTTSVATEYTVDLIIAYKEFFPNLCVSPQFTRRICNNEIIVTPQNNTVLTKLLENNVNIVFNTLNEPPYAGTPCLSGYKVFEVMHDGNIYDCLFNTDKILLGNINIKKPLIVLTPPRLCNSLSMICIDMALNGCGLIKKS